MVLLRGLQGEGLGFRALGFYLGVGFEASGSVRVRFSASAVERSLSLLQRLPECKVWGYRDTLEDVRGFRVRETSGSRFLGVGA